MDPRSLWIGLQLPLVQHVDLADSEPTFYRNFLTKCQLLGSDSLNIRVPAKTPTHTSSSTPPRGVDLGYG